MRLHHNWKGTNVGDGMEGVLQQRFERSSHAPVFPFLLFSLMNASWRATGAEQGRRSYPLSVSSGPRGLAHYFVQRPVSPHRRSLCLRAEDNVHAARAAAPVMSDPRNICTAHASRPNRHADTRWSRSLDRQDTGQLLVRVVRVVRAAAFIFEHSESITFESST